MIINYLSETSKLSQNGLTNSKQTGAEMKIKIGDNIGWMSAAGYWTGTVSNIVLDLNAAGETIPWIDIEIQGRSGVRLCATDSYLKQMRVELI